MKQEIYIHFGGFYNSIHDAQIESQFELHEDGADSEAQERDYTKTQVNYSKKYLKKMEQFLFDNKIEVEFNFVMIESPRQYNFETDRIVVNILKKHQKSIINFVNDKFAVELIELIRQQTTARDGYRPFYTFNEIYKENKNDLLLEACIEIICNEINKDELPHEFELDFLALENLEQELEKIENERLELNQKELSIESKIEELKAKIYARKNPVLEA